MMRNTLKMQCEKASATFQESHVYIIGSKTVQEHLLFIPICQLVLVDNIDF